ncbi:MAG TPA: class I SAM-dependent methyltransferase [Candidatus Bathyarchaeia archaeon]|nr:class I SAM-dependent methyltransferase [Candidatus Bathyarchaeia archaeon]
MNVEEYATMFSVEDTHWWYRGLRGMVRRAWGRHMGVGPVRVLDAGCGTGAILAMLRAHARAQSARPVGVDLMPEAIRFCRIRQQNVTAAASVVALPFPDGAFDAALSLDVLCHRSIRDKRAPLLELGRVLRPGGILILNLPAYQWLYSSHDVAVHTDTRFTKGQAVGLLGDCGFSVIEATYWNSLLFPPIVATRLWRKIFPPSGSDLASGGTGALNALFRIVLGLERALLRLTPMPMGLSLFLVARKGESGQSGQSGHAGHGGHGAAEPQPQAKST